MSALKESRPLGLPSQRHLLQPNGTVMSTDGLSDEFNLDHGVLQGDTLASVLFIIVLDYTLRRALDKDASLSEIKNGQWGFFLRDRKSPALHLTDTDLAEDIGRVLRGDPANARRRNQGDKSSGLVHQCPQNQVHIGDLVDTPGTITVHGVPIERKEDFKYLGSYVGSVDRDIEERCKAASRAYGRLMPVWKAPLRVETKLRVFKAMVEPVMFYACETWPLTLRREHRLTSHWFRPIRQIVNCRWPFGEPMSQFYWNSF